MDPTTSEVQGDAERPDSPLGTGPFHAALREAIRRRGLTLDRLGWYLARQGVPVALSTLSDWQHGHSRPGSPNSFRALRALEEILGLSSNSLVRLLVAPGSDARPNGHGRTTLRPTEGLDEDGGGLAELLDSLGGERDRGVEILNCHDKVFVGADRRALRVITRTVVRARRENVDRYVMRFVGSEGCDIDQVCLRARENCRLGQVLRRVSRQRSSPSCCSARRYRWVRRGSSRMS